MASDQLRKDAAAASDKEDIHMVSGEVPLKVKQAKDTITTAQTPQQEKGSEVKETTTVQKIGGYVGEKAVAAKDMAVGAGKTTVGYTGKVAVDARDRAVVAGWGVANYTTEKTVAATKAAADAVGGVAGYVGGKAAGAKDTVTEYVGEKIVCAKDAVISAEESLAEYTARKKAEAETNKGSRGVGINDGNDIEGSVFTVGGDGDGENKEKDGEGVFQAIGETLVEIVQGTSKPPFVVGSDQGYSGGKVIEKEE